MSWHGELVMMELGPLASVVMLLGLATYGFLMWERRDRRKEGVVQQTLADLAAMGEQVAPSLSPRIEPAQCIGSGACVRACPEKGVIGLVDGQAKLVNPLACVGHGACAAACPVQAIRLVYGTQTRGVELPRVNPNFETSQPGVYIIGELGGMGLIRNAVAQGRRAAEHVIAGDGQRPLRRGCEGGEGGHERLRDGTRERAHDAIVVGAGPAGISATLRLMEAGLDVQLLEREAFGGTIMHYPRAKVVMTGRLDLPLFGTVRNRTMSKEELVGLWGEIQRRVSPPVHVGELVEALIQDADGMWRVRSNLGERRAANVLLALGVRGSPRKLGVPGEEQPKVSYRLLEPQEFGGQHVLVVGGGNSAVESALALAESGGCASVGLSYRKTALARCRGDNRARITQAFADGSVQAHMPSELVDIGETDVTLAGGDAGPRKLRNDAVIIQIGGTPPAALLRTFGIELITKYGEA